MISFILFITFLATVATVSAVIKAYNNSSSHKAIISAATAVLSEMKDEAKTVEQKVTEEVKAVVPSHSSAIPPFK